MEEQTNQSTTKQQDAQTVTGGDKTPAMSDSISAEVAKEVQKKDAKKVEVQTRKGGSVQEEKKGELITGSGKKPKDEKSRLIIKVSILGAIIFILFVGLLTLLGRLPLIANEIKNVKTETASVSDEKLRELEQQLTTAQPKVEQISKFFPDESGIVDFIGEIDKLKAEGVIDSFSFANGAAVMDKSKSYALPVLIEVKGNINRISSAIERIQSLPYIIRAVNIKISTAETLEIEGEEGEIVIVPDTSGDTLELKYGGLIYVDEDLGKN